jgi:mRNA-degrading endonuclease toxin of MazEF toxin-antitoxin module
VTARPAWTPGCGDVILVRMSRRAGCSGALPGTCALRPALVLSPAAFSARSGRAIVCPIADRPLGNPFEVKVPRELDAGAVVLADRITSIDVRACGVRLVCPATSDAVTVVREKLQILIGLPFE